VNVELAAPAQLRDGEVTLLPVDDRVPTLLVAASNDIEITTWTQVPEAMSLTDAAMVVAAWAGGRSNLRLQVCVPDLAPAGMVTVWVNTDGEAEVGYWLLEAVRGRGIGRRALRLLCAWAFATSGVARIQLTTLPGNSASEKVAVACGFRATGSVIRDVKGEPRTLMMWELTAGDLSEAAGQRAATGT
jgi:[ribosomal protein S5]-alanine N-acetyltransferase